MTREEALQIIWDRCQHSKETEKALEVLKEERPQGEWLPMITKDDYGEQVLGYKCKRCGWLKPHDKMPFCENCGANMRKGE